MGVKQTYGEAGVQMANGALKIGPRLCRGCASGRMYREKTRITFLVLGAARVHPRPSLLAAHRMVRRQTACHLALHSHEP
jgi:hypothetical protein